MCLCMDSLEKYNGIPAVAFIRLNVCSRSLYAQSCILKSSYSHVSTNPICDKVYIGETRRALGTRLKEHQANTRRGEVEKSAIAEHAWGEEHRPAWDETAILERARREDILRIKEAFCIMAAEQEKLLNRDRGTFIAESWKPLLWRWRNQRVMSQLFGASNDPSQRTSPDATPR